ncbi:hypothetical protein [Hymenobacter sp. YC55]|uniref:hypothetical protein n=1 Tax=Hymenobacter sp. YC55 TaxID=3034019 RepID=UPI0023F9D013|nr:hypothetical protein [Hymenobacter sp. YC55]MDF7811946.1 hypothetical protein [Hymenobacter sp. YC55]
MSSFHFVVWQSVGSRTSQHLALFAQAPVAGDTDSILAHWVLPELTHHRLAQQSHSLLVETTLLPPPTHLLDMGECTLLTGDLPLQAEQERLCFDFEGHTLRGHFAMLRLRPGGSRWLFGRLQFMPDKFQRGSQVAPLWPSTQTTSV